VEAAVKLEYEMVHAEIVDVRDCITEYMKTFFALAVGVIGVFVFFSGKQSAAVLTVSPASNAASTVSLVPDLTWLTPAHRGFILLALCEVILFFVSLLFHKFNTHNRGCGYMRALEMERHGVDLSNATPDQKVPRGQETRLWQSALAVPFQDEEDFRWGRVETKDHFDKLRHYCGDAEQKCRHPFSKPFRSLRRSADGLWMIFRATIYRSHTRSWTFPFQVAFGPFIVTLFLALTWGFATEHVYTTPLMIIQLLLVADLFISWLGLGYRMFRLCGEVGDRTIELWCWRTMVQRHEALGLDRVRVVYVGWVPKAASG
jgi:hypothetical protein